MPEPVARQRPEAPPPARPRSFRAGARTWGAVVRRAACDLWANHAMEWAAALAFYALLSLFPLLLAASAVAAYAVEPAWAVARLTDLLAGFVPPGVVDAEAVVGRAIAERGRVGLLAILAWLLAGRRVLGALVTALDLVSDVDARRESVRRRALVEAVLLLGIGALFALALASGPLLALVGDVAGAAPGPRGATVWAAVAAARVLLLVATFYAVYALVPHGARGRRAALVGAGAAAALFLAARAAFLAVLGRLWASFDLLYGPLAVGALLLLWAWYVGLIVLFGGSLASHAKVMLAEGHSAAEAERRHVARKPAADAPAGGT